MRRERRLPHHQDQRPPLLQENFSGPVDQVAAGPLGDGPQVPMEQGTTTMARARNEPLAMGAVKSSTRCQTAPGANCVGVNPNSRAELVHPPRK